MLAHNLGLKVVAEDIETTEPDVRAQAILVANSARVTCSPNPLIRLQSGDHLASRVDGVTSDEKLRRAELDSIG